MEGVTTSTTSMSSALAQKALIFTCQNSISDVLDSNNILIIPVGIANYSGKTVRFNSVGDFAKICRMISNLISDCNQDPTDPSRTSQDSTSSFNETRDSFSIEVPCIYFNSLVLILKYFQFYEQYKNFIELNMVGNLSTCTNDSLESIKEIITKPFHAVEKKSNDLSTSSSASASQSTSSSASQSASSSASQSASSSASSADMGLSASSTYTNNNDPNSIAEFVAQLLSTSTFKEVEDLITVVNYLDIPLFLHGIAKYIADTFIHNKTPEQIRTTFGFSDDLDPEEKAEIESGVAFLNEEQLKVWARLHPEDARLREERLAKKKLKETEAEHAAVN